MQKVAAPTQVMQVETHWMQMGTFMLPWLSMGSTEMNQPGIPKQVVQVMLFGYRISPPAQVTHDVLDPEHVWHGYTHGKHHP